MNLTFSGPQNPIPFLRNVSSGRQELLDRCRSRRYRHTFNLHVSMRFARRLFRGSRRWGIARVSHDARQHFDTG